SRRGAGFGPQIHPFFVAQQPGDDGNRRPVGCVVRVLRQFVLTGQRSRQAEGKIERNGSLSRQRQARLTVVHLGRLQLVVFVDDDRIVPGRVTLVLGFFAGLELLPIIAVGKRTKGGTRKWWPRERIPVLGGPQRNRRIGGFFPSGAGVFGKGDDHKLRQVAKHVRQLRLPADALQRSAVAELQDMFSRGKRRHANPAERGKGAANPRGT